MDIDGGNAQLMTILSFDTGMCMSCCKKPWLPFWMMSSFRLFDLFCFSYYRIKADPVVSLTTKPHQYCCKNWNNQPIDTDTIHITKNTSWSSGVSNHQTAPILLQQSDIWSVFKKLNLVSVYHFVDESWIIKQPGCCSCTWFNRIFRFKMDH